MKANKKEILKKLVDLELSQAAFARGIDLPIPIFNNIINDHFRANPYLMTKIATALSCEIEEIFIKEGF